MQGSRAYVSTEYSKLQVLSVANPTAPTIIGTRTRHAEPSAASQAPPMLLPASSLPPANAALALLLTLLS